MKITMIRPPAIRHKNSFHSGTSIAPAGFAYLIGALKSENHEVTAIDAVGEGLEQYKKISELKAFVNGLSAEQIVARIPFDTQLIGMSCMFSSEWFYDEYVLHLVRQKFPHIPIVIGGEHVTAEWKNIFDSNADVDFCVLGEGEETLLELISAIEKKQTLSDISGLSFRQNNKIIKTAARKRKKKLEELAPPAWDSLPIYNYLNTGGSMTTLNRRSIPLVASRGCPFSCTFCSAAQMWGNELTLRSPESIVSEIKNYVQKYQVKHIDFLDIVGVINRRWSTEVFKLLAKENLDVTWLHGAGTRSEVLDNDMLNLFKASKALRVFYAPESGSPSTLARLRKRLDLKKMMASMKMCNELGISMRAPLIFGFPGQTLREAFESVVFALRMTLVGVDDVVVHPFTPYPGSAYHDSLVASGRIDMKKMISDGTYATFLSGLHHNSFLESVSYSEHIPGWSLPLFQFGTMSMHYALRLLIRPWRMLDTLKRVFIEKSPLTFFDHVIYAVLFGKKLNSQKFEEDGYSAYQKEKKSIKHSSQNFSKGLTEPNEQTNPELQ